MRNEISKAEIGGTEHNVMIMAALLDALCSPQLYEITMQAGELFIRPRPGMHPQAVP